MKMKHPASNLTLEASPDTVAMYESQGWYRVTASKAAKEAAKKTAADIAAETPPEQ